MNKIKILYRKNLKMSPGKLAAQCVHAALGLRNAEPMMSVIVLGVSDKKFQEAKSSAIYVVRDAGYTEVEPGTETCLAFYEDDVLPAKDALPSIDEFIGSDPEFTGNMTTEEYIRSIRHETN